MLGIEEFKCNVKQNNTLLNKKRNIIIRLTAYLEILCILVANIEFEVLSESLIWVDFISNYVICQNNVKKAEDYEKCPTQDQEFL